jgi:predicted RNA-binding Zn-ribbon protein involved in translation (DUF1610 family)
MKPADDEKQAIRDDDEATRLEYESCPACGKDLGSEIEHLDECPDCGEDL